MNWSISDVKKEQEDLGAGSSSAGEKKKTVGAVGRSSRLMGVALVPRHH